MNLIIKDCTTHHGFLCFVQKVIIYVRHGITFLISYLPIEQIQKDWCCSTFKFKAYWSATSPLDEVNKGLKRYFALVHYNRSQ